MTPLFPSHRAAEELDAALAGTASPAVAERHADLLATVATLRSVDQASPRPEFAAQLREQLMLAARTELVPAPPVLHRARTTNRASHRVGSVAAALVIVGGTTGMAAAAAGSLPGEALYPIKRGGEQVGEAVRLTDAGKGRALLGQAGTRLTEVRDLMAGGDASPALVGDTVAAFRSAADSGSTKLFESYQRDGQAADVTAVRTFAAEQMRAIDLMVAGSDPDEAAFLLDAADTLADIDQQARSLCGSCGSDEALLTPTALSEAAAAASVSNLLARPSDQAQSDVDAARLAALAKRSQTSADATPKLTLPGSSGASPDSAASEPVTRAVSGSGQLSAGVKAGTTAVNGLVQGATSTVDSATGGAVSGLTGTVDDTTRTVTGTVDDTIGGLLPKP